MKKTFVLLAFTFGLYITSASADELKNSLTNIMNEKESSSIVDLGNINLNAKPKPKQVAVEARSPKSVIATINGHKIIKKDADAYLSKRTEGKVKNFDLLPNNQKGRLLQELVLPILAHDAANKELSDEEKQIVYTRAWMRKEASTIKISDDEILTVYNQLKKQSEENNVSKPIPPFDSIKDSLKMQIIERKMVSELMENVKIEVL